MQLATQKPGRQKRQRPTPRRWFIAALELVVVLHFAFIGQRCLCGACGQTHARPTADAPAEPEHACCAGMHDDAPGDAVGPGLHDLDACQCGQGHKTAALMVAPDSSEDEATAGLAAVCAWPVTLVLPVVQVVRNVTIRAHGPPARCGPRLYLSLNSLLI
jgi:hypothetical protein